MYCVKCGALNEDQAVFCKNCGERMSADGNAGRFGNTRETAASLIKKRMGSPALLVAVIAKTVAALGIVCIVALGVLAAIAPSYVSEAFISSYYYNGDDYYYDYYDDDYYDSDDDDIHYDPNIGFFFDENDELKTEWVIALAIPALVMGLCLLASGVLKLISMWMIYISARKKNTDRIGTAGFDALKTSAIANLLGKGIGIYVVTVLALALINNLEILWNTYEGFLNIVLIVIAAVVVLTSALTDIMLIVDMSAIKGTLSEGGKIKKPSLYIIIMLFASALLGTFVFPGLNVLSVTFDIALAVFLIQYRSDVAKFRALNA